MESVADYYLYWAVYLLAAVAGFWCWGRIPFWVRNRGVAYHIYSAVGAVIIFTPLPVVSGAGQTLSPGFVALPFTLISEGIDGVTPFAVWYLTAAGLAAFATLVGFVAGLAPEHNEDGRNAQEKSAGQAPKSVKGNPFA